MWRAVVGALVALSVLSGCAGSGGDCPTTSFDHALASAPGPLLATSCAEVIAFGGVEYAVWCEMVHSERIGDVLTEAKAESEVFSEATYSSVREIKGVDIDTAIVVNVEREGSLDEPDACVGDQLAVALDDGSNRKALIRKVSSPP